MQFLKNLFKSFLSKWGNTFILLCANIFTLKNHRQGRKMRVRLSILKSKYITDTTTPDQNETVIYYNEGLLCTPHIFASPSDTVYVHIQGIPSYGVYLSALDTDSAFYVLLTGRFLNLIRYGLLKYIYRFKLIWWQLIPWVKTPRNGSNMSTNI